MNEMLHQQYMDLALELARRGEGRTAPNPPVGAVIVRNQRIVGRGFHPRAGEPHAEIFALREAGAETRGADLYVTLEPCSHHGRTGPCAEAVIAAGIKRVFVGVVDPNPQVAGRGLEKLRAVGIEVQSGIREQACRRLIAPFARHISSGLPFTIYKTAMTLDGNTAAASGDSHWVSGAESRLRVHRLRDRVEAIMVGIETVLNDDPALTTRLPEGNGRDPLRVVVDSHLRIDPGCRLLRQTSESGTLIATTNTADPVKMERLRQAGAEVLAFSPSSGQVDLSELWRELGRRDVQRLLLEGGATLAASALQADLIDQLMLFVAPKMIGGHTPYGIFSGKGCAGMADARKLSELRYEQSGEDILLIAELKPCLPG